MKTQLLALTTSAFVLAQGAVGANAQQAGNPMMQQPAQHGAGQQQEPERRLRAAQGQRRGGEDSDADDWHARMMRQHREGGMMGMGGMMGGAMGAPVMMRMIFGLMDADGDGTISLEEFKAAHERIFKAMDADRNGKLTLDEMLAFMRGARRPAARP